MVKIRTHFNYNPDVAFEDVDETSLAVPDQSYSIQDLFDRMACGSSIDSIIRPVVWADEDDDIDDTDPTQRPDFDLADYSEEIDSLTQSVQLRKSEADFSSNAEQSVAKDENSPSDSVSVSDV